MAKCAFIPNFLRFYNMLWQAALPFLKSNPRLSSTFDRRMTPKLCQADIWIQSASAGEAFLALSILSRLAPPEPVRVLVTTTTDQGLGVLRQGILNLPACSNLRVNLDLFPFDTLSAVKTAVQQVNPKVMVLLETEIWPGLFHELKQNKTQVLILNARLSRKSGFRYRKTKWLWQCLAPDLIMAISDTDRQRYETVFPHTPVTVMNNIKFDVMESRNQNTPHPESDLHTLFSGPLPLSVLASFRRQEEKEILVLLNRLRSEIPDQIIALFPRHMHRIPAVRKQLQKQGIPFVLRSEIHRPITTPCVILWDKFGELRQAYAFAHTVFVGGSLQPLGGQNFLEPAVLGVPAVTGPFWEDFAWVGKEIFDLGFITCVPNASAAATVMAENLKTAPDRGMNREKAKTYIASRRGGSAAACRAILDCLNKR